MRLFLSAIAALTWASAAPGAGRAANVEFDADACREQVEALARIDLNCVVLARPNIQALEHLPETMAVILNALRCELPLAFSKEQIYGSFVREGAVRLPVLEVSCKHESGEGTSVVIRTQITCDRIGELWTCQPGVRGVEGLGFLGTALTNWINESGVWEQLADELGRRD